MSEKININNMKGDTNVELDESKTMLRTKNVFDVSSAGVARAGKGDWDSFELMGSSNRDEGEGKFSPERQVDSEAFEKKLRDAHVGRMVLSLKLAA